MKGDEVLIPSQMLKGVLEGCILSTIEKKEVYGYEISQILEEMNFGKISEGTIYPILLRLEKNKSIEAVYKISDSGPKRKYFHLTDAGARALDEFKDSWKEINHAVNKTLGGEKNE